MGKYTIKGHDSFLISIHKYTYYNEKREERPMDRMISSVKERIKKEFT